MSTESDHYEHRSCSVCGARTEDEAGNLCQSYQLPTGDYTCNGGAEEEAYPDGRLRFLSPAGLDAINAWVDEQVAKDQAIYAEREQHRIEAMSIADDRDRLIHILVVHYDMFRDKAEEAADLFLHDKALSTPPVGAETGEPVEKLGRFDHHPDPAIDFEIEVQCLEARLFDAKGGISKPGTEPETVVTVLADIERAMTFRVGGDPITVAAKQILRQLETDAKEALPAPPRSDKANGDWVMVPREPTREMWAAMGNVLVGYKNRHHDKVAADLYAAILSASLVSQEAGE